MVLSVSASYQDAVSKYAWMKYTGSRGKEVSQRTHKRMIREGDIFGILPLRNGGRYTLIFPDMPHVDFPLDKSTGLFLMERASKLRKVPDVVNREVSGRTKTAGAKTMERQLNRSQFDAARFSPRRVPSESVYGVNFDNYQWRMVASPEYPVKTSKGMTKLYKNDMIGVRFLRQGKGGIIINSEGMFLKVDDAQYDLVVHDTNILPFNDWPKGVLTADDVKAYRRIVRRARRRSAEEEQEAQRLANNAKILEQKQQRKELQKEANKKKRERESELSSLRKKVRSGEVEIDKPEVRTVYEDGVDKRGKRIRVIEEEVLDDEIEEVEIDADLDEQKLEDILARSPFAGDAFNIEDSIGSLFGGDDSQDIDEPALDLSDIDEPEDDEEDVPPKKVRAKAGKKATAPVEEEEDPDAEEDTDDSDTDVDDADDGDTDSDADDESVDDDAADDEGADSEGEDGEDEESEEDESADTSDAVDETEADEDTDSDVAAAEQEAKETAKKIAAANKSTPQHRAEEAEEGDVLRFKADAKLNRDWVIVRVSTHSTSDNIVIYTLYDITNSPDEVRQVRVNRARKQNLFDYAEHVKDMAPKLFNRVLDMTEDFPVNKDPIAS